MKHVRIKITCHKCKAVGSMTINKKQLKTLLEMLS